MTWRTCVPACTREDHWSHCVHSISYRIPSALALYHLSPLVQSAGLEQLDPYLEHRTELIIALYHVSSLMQTDEKDEVLL